MTAKEMFEELGYKYGKYAEEIICTKEDRQWREVGEITIDFDLQGKTIELGFNGRISNSLPLFITLEELQAINKQIEELWGDEILKKNGNK